MKVLLKHYIPALIALLWLIPSNIFAKSPINVHVSILPQKYFVEKIGKDKVKVDVLVKPGKSPATYSPSPDQIKRLASSDVYFRIGVPFENSILHKIRSIAGATIVDTRKGVVLRKRDPHIWMNPLIVKTQAYTIFLTLSNIDPDNRDEYKKNYDWFAKELEELDNRLKTILKELKGENLFVFHPVFGYFTDAYGLKQVAVETMGKTPKGKALSNLIKLAKKQKVRVIFVQPQFDRNAAKKIASAINGAVVSIDPLAFNYLANMENIAQNIIKALPRQHQSITKTLKSK